jgi:hypothetical protein
MHKPDGRVFVRASASKSLVSECWFSILTSRSAKASLQGHERDHILFFHEFDQEYYVLVLDGML